jgi:hypothetical protein
MRLIAHIENGDGKKNELNQLNVVVLGRVHELAAKEREPVAKIFDNETAGNGGIAARIGSVKSKNQMRGTASESGQVASETGAHDAVLLSKM